MKTHLPEEVSKTVNIGVCQGNASYNHSEMTGPRPSEQLKFKKPQKQMLARMWRNGITPASLVGMRNGTASLENRLAVSLKAEHTLP